MLKVRRSVVVDLARFGFSDIAGAPVGAIDLAALLTHVLAGVAIVVAESEQERRFLAPENG